MNDEQQRPQPPAQPEQPAQSEPAQPEGAQPEPAPAGEQPPPGWGAPPPPAKAPRWSVRHTVTAAVIAVVAAVAAGGTVYAVSDARAGDRGGPREVPEAPGEMRVGPMRGGPTGDGPMGDAEHGEFQHGEVTAISEDSITAKSEDGYTRTYVIDADTVLTDGIEQGDDVMIVATTSEGDEATARSVSEPGEGPPPRRMN